MSTEQVESSAHPAEPHSPAAGRGPRVVARRFEAAAGPEEAVEAVCDLLLGQCAVSPAGCGVAIRREHHQPSGLPAHTPFALFSLGEPGALRSAVAVAIFAQPVSFHRLDDPTASLPLRLVIGVSDPERSRQALTISLLIDALARENLSERLGEVDATAAAAAVAGVVHGHVA